MDGNDRVRAWLLLAAGDDRGHGGNHGYDDQYDAYYSWDSLVPNSKAIRAGDPVALWDKRRLLGTSVIEEIESGPSTKILNRCPECRTTRITHRKTRSPLFRCNACKHEFDLPRVEVAEVTAYRARFDAAWTPLEGVLGADELRAATSNPREFNAMRSLDWSRFTNALERAGALKALHRVEMRLPDVTWPASGGVAVDVPQGFRNTLVRVRRGQGRFRERLLESQGNSCAFTGAAPERVLEAGHLYSYARLGAHFEHGGLMLRRDIHRLFDDGALAVSPDSLRIDVDPSLAAYPQYASLHDLPMQASIREEQAVWLVEHWEEHRGVMRA